MARILRQVDIVLQNHTRELLTLESSLASLGDWLGDPPKVGSVVPSQGASRWRCGSTDDMTGTGGFLHLGSTKGYIHIQWLLPHDVTKLEFEFVAPGCFEATYVNRGPNRDHVVMLLTLTPNPAPIVRQEDREAEILLALEAEELSEKLIE